MAAAVRPVVALARVALVRVLRERANLFFIFVFPLLIVLVVGATFGAGFEPVIIVVDQGESAFGEELLAALSGNEAVEVRTDDRADALDAVAAGSVAAVVIVRTGVDEASSANPSSIGYVSRPGTGGEQVRAIVLAEIEQLGIPSRVVAGLTAIGVDPAQARDAVAGAGRIEPPAVDIETVAGTAGPTFEGLGQFDLGAAQQLVLFTFIAALASAVGLIQMREWGITRRLQATPISAGQVIAGLALGRWAMALFQALYIMVATTMIFGVNWGSWLPSLVVIAVFSGVAASAGLLAGAVMRNQAQANGVAIFVALTLAALGGCMLPLEVMPDSLRTVAHVTPHAWALDAFADVVRRDAGVGGILPELGVLLAFLVVLVTLASWRLGEITSRA